MISEVNYCDHSSMIAAHTSHSYLTAQLPQTQSIESQSNIDYKDDNINVDDDVLHNKRLKSRRDTLLEEYIK